VGTQKELRVASADALLHATRTTELAGALATLLAAPSLARAALAAFCDAAAIVRAWDVQQVRRLPRLPALCWPGRGAGKRGAARAPDKCALRGNECWAQLRCAACVQNDARGDRGGPCRGQALARDDTPALLDALGALLGALHAGRAGPLPPGGAAAAARAAWGLVAHLLDRGLPAARALLAAGARSTVVRGRCLAPARCVAALVCSRAERTRPVSSACAALHEARPHVFWRRNAESCSVSKF